MLFLIWNINQVVSRTERCTIIHFSIRILDTVRDLTG